MDEAFLTVIEVAEILKVNQQTVRNWIDRGDLPAIRVGRRRVRVRQADFDAFLRRSIGQGTSAAELTEEELEELAYAAVKAAADGASAVEKVATKHVGQAQAILDLALSDFVVELNRALAESVKHYGLDGNEFMRRYNAVWNAKLALR